MKLTLRCAICMALVASAASAMQIATDGEAQAVIATPPSPAPSVAYAAKELAKYLGKMTGAPFEGQDLPRHRRGAARPALRRLPPA